MWVILVIGVFGIFMYDVISELNDIGSSKNDVVKINWSKRFYHDVDVVNFTYLVWVQQGLEEGEYYYEIIAPEHKISKVLSRFQPCKVISKSWDVYSDRAKVMIVTRKRIEFT
jgi:hypothetical protein